MINGHALSHCCREKRAILVERRRTIGALSKQFSGSCALAVRGVTCQQNWVIGIAPTFVLHAGEKREFGNVLPLLCAAMRIWSTYSSTRPSSVLISTQLALKKSGQQEIGRSSGGLTTKLHVAVDALGNPVQVILSAGQVSDINLAPALINDQCAQFIVADRGYDSDSFISTIAAQGAQAVIPPRSNRIDPRPFDRHIYGSRNLIERFFARIKQFRRIATRYDKLAKSFLSFVHLASIVVWLA